jgi:hypothetical protein
VHALTGQLVSGARSLTSGSVHAVHDKACLSNAHAQCRPAFGFVFPPRLHPLRCGQSKANTLHLLARFAQTVSGMRRVDSPTLIATSLSTVAFSRTCRRNARISCRCTLSCLLWARAIEARALSAAASIMRARARGSWVSAMMDELRSSDFFLKPPAREKRFISTC